MAMKKNRYSTVPAPEVITFLVGSLIPFACCKGYQSEKQRVFFTATADTADILCIVTGYNLKDENDGWDFDGWDAIMK